MERIIRNHFIWGVGLSLLTFSSCEKDKVDDLLHGLDKLECTSYLNNASGQSVCVCINGQDADQHTYNLKKDEVHEIPDTERWHLYQHTLAEDSVVFTFEDGSRVVHRYRNLNYGEGTDNIVYEPSENNVFCVDNCDNNSWVMSRVRAKKYKYEYVIHFASCESSQKLKD